MRRQNVLVFYDSNNERVLGSDGSVITELKTQKGICNRYQALIKRMVSKGCKYRIYSYNTWLNIK